MGTKFAARLSSQQTFLRKELPCRYTAEGGVRQEKANSCPPVACKVLMASVMAQEGEMDNGRGRGGWSNSSRNSPVLRSICACCEMKFSGLQDMAPVSSFHCLLSPVQLNISNSTNKPAPCGPKQKWAEAGGALRDQSVLCLPQLQSDLS